MAAFLDMEPSKLEWPYSRCKRQSWYLRVKENNLLTFQCYVQDLLRRNGIDVVRSVFQDHGHFYVCGDVDMAHGVGETLEKLLVRHGKLSEQKAAEYVFHMKVR